MSAVVPSWMATPPIEQPRRRSAGSSSSAVTIHGPTGQKPGIDLPRSHWSPSSHGSRDETSFMHVKPKTWSIAASTPTFAAVAPMTTPSSTSGSTLAVSVRSHDSVAPCSATALAALP